MNQKLHQVYSDKQLENLVMQSHYGCDEAGRGALNGPVVAAAVNLGNASIPELNDSKQLSESARDELFEKITTMASDVSIAVVSPSAIDRLNILNATMSAMLQSYVGRKGEPNLMLIDGNRVPEIPDGARFFSVVKGDAKVPAISAASIIAKVTRDNIMMDLAQTYPEMKYEVHKGYGTALHLEMIDKHGINDSYRMTFKPIRERFGVHQKSLF